MMQEFPVIYEWSGRNFSGYAPDVSGCMATAKTLPLMRSKLKGALEAHLAWMEKDGEQLPKPSAAVTVDMAQDEEFPHPAGYYVIVERLLLAMPTQTVSSSTEGLSISLIGTGATERPELQIA